jgi:hypothetical protein
MIPLEQATQAVNDMTRRVALLYLSFARTLVDTLGEDQGRALIAQIMRDYGTRIGRATRERVEALGLEPTPENFNLGSDLSPIGFHAGVAEADGEPRRQVFGCVLAEVWRAYGEEELADLYCLVDPAKMEAYNPDFTMTHTRKVLWGDECCEMATRRIRPARRSRGG